MKAFPHLRGTGGAEQVTAVTCPDCPGVLEVSEQGVHGYLRFRCRIGHTYSLQGLIESKERRLEDLLWAPVTALNELAALLRDLVELGEAIGSPEAYEERAVRALRHADVVRAVLEENEKTTLNPRTAPRRGGP